MLNRLGGGEGCGTRAAAGKDEDIGCGFRGEIGCVRDYLDIASAGRILVLEVYADGRDLEARADEDCMDIAVSRTRSMVAHRGMRVS